jgi:hypothetical protein
MDAAFVVTAILILDAAIIVGFHHVVSRGKTNENDIQGLHYLSQINGLQRDGETLRRLT